MTKFKTNKGHTILVDDEDAIKLRGYTIGETIPETVSGKPVFSVNVLDGFIYVPRLIMGVTDRNLCVTWRSQDRYDMRKSNLAVVSRSVLRHTACKVREVKGKPIGTRFLGVKQHGSRWMATLQGGESPLYLGLFDDAVTAAKVWDKAARARYGEHAQVNFPQP